MAKPPFRAPDAAPSPSQNGATSPGGARADSSPLDRLSQSERGQDNALPYGEAETERGLALYDNNGAALDVGDDAAMREFYGRLVGLLTQEGEGEAARKKGRGGLMTALRRRWLPALILSALAFVGLYSVLKPRQATYRASTTLLLPPREKGKTTDPFAPPEDSYDTAAQLAIIGSDKIVRNAMSHVPPPLRQSGWGDPNAQLAGVSVSALNSDSLIDISASSNNSKASLRLVQEMVRAYTSYTKNRYSQNKGDNLRTTKDRLQQTARELAAARTQLRNFKQRTGIFDAALQQSASSAKINELSSSLDAARRDAATVTADDATLQQLRQSAVDAGVVLQNLQRNFEDSAPRVQAARADYDRAQNRAEARAAQLVSASNQKIAELEGSLSQAKSAAAALPAAEQQLNQLNQRVSLLDAAYRDASDRASALDLASGDVAATAKPLNDQPGVGSDRGTLRARALGVSFLGALILGLLCAIVLDRLDRSVRAANDPEALFEAPILGALPAVRARGALFIGNSDAKGSARARTATIEACTNAQTHILGAANALGARSILITSSIPEEGKSQCAANLAAAMAYGGRQVLLIDADFWHPSQNEILGQELAPGYVQVLRDEIPLSEAIRPTSVRNLHLLTAGQKVNPGNKKGEGGNSAEMGALLSSENHFHAQEVLKRFFDVIIVDAPPVMSVSDAQLLSGLTDATVLIAADGTNRDQVQRARAMLRLAGAGLLGVVINSVRLGEVQRWNVDFTPEEPFSNYNTALSTR